MSDLFLSPSVSAASVGKFIDDCRDSGIFPRAVQIVRGQEPLLRMCFPPYSFSDRIHIYSLSKSFTSVAVGICCDMGLLSPETRLTELFRDKMPAELTPYLEAMKLSDLLTMQSGHGVCALSEMRSAPDSIKAFFAQELPYEPGTTFVYSTGATCVCAAAVERVTKRKLVDFLDEKLFSVLDIEKPVWLECADGQTIGGTGLYVSSDDITKFGMMLKNGGVYNGRRIVSEKYLSEATSAHSVDKNNGSPDWISGYGYQFWMNARGGFRGDGAYGQLCMVFPESDTVFTFLGEVTNMQREVTLIYELLDRLFAPDGGSEKTLEEKISSFYRTPKYSGEPIDFSFPVAENPCGIRSVRLCGENILHAVLDTDYGVKEIACGNGEYIGNLVRLRCLSPSINRFDPRFGKVEPVSVAASYSVADDGKITVLLRHLDTPHSQRWVFDGTAKEWKIDICSGELACRRFVCEKNNAETVDS